MVIIPNVDIIFSYGIVWQQNMEEISYAGSGSRIRRKLPKRLVLFGGLFLVVIILLGLVGFFITRGNSSDSDDEVSQSITLPDEPEEITEEPTPTEEPSITPEESKTPTKTPTKTPVSTNTSNSDVSINVQNGSGEAGVAGTAADVLKSAGFTISSTGNADNFDYQDVTIQIKNSEKAALADIEEALSADYTVGNTSTDLPENTSYDVLVIVGS